MCTANQNTGFYIKCNTKLKWVNPFCTNTYKKARKMAGKNVVLDLSVIIEL